MTAVFGSPGRSRSRSRCPRAFAASISAARATVKRLAGQLLVAGHHHRHAAGGRAPRPRAAPSSAWIMTTSPPFMSMMPGPRAVRSSMRSNRWNGLSGSNTVSRCPISSTRGPVPATLGDEMAGALERRAVDPAGGEPERVELAAEDVADRAHAGEVHRSAVDVDHALEQGQRLRIGGVDGRDDRLFLWRHASSLHCRLVAADAAPGPPRPRRAAAPCRAPLPRPRCRRRGESCRRCPSACDSRHDPRRRNRETAPSALWNGPVIGRLRPVLAAGDAGPIVAEAHVDRRVPWRPLPRSGLSAGYGVRAGDVDHVLVAAADHVHVDDCGDAIERHRRVLDEMRGRPAGPPPRASNATNTSDTGAGLVLNHRATASIAATPDALSSAPGCSGAVPDADVVVVGAHQHVAVGLLGPGQQRDEIGRVGKFLAAAALLVNENFCSKPPSIGRSSSCLNCSRM